MSSILDALKKLEKESEEQNQAPSWPDRVSGQKLNYRLSRSSRVKRYLMVLFLAGFTIVIGGVYLNYISQKEPITVTDTLKKAPFNVDSIEKQPVPPITPGRQPTRVTTPVQESSPVTPPLTKPPLETTLSMKASPYPDVARPPAPEIDESAEPLSQNSIVEKELSGKTAAPEKKKKGPSLDVKEDPRIDIQAIAWAPDEKDSFAVINNRIVREGESVGGVKILHIEEKSISLQDGGSKWQQNFKIR